ncbi:MAG: MBL fold metallo-hydrolase [Woeseiaceae bacterium]|nr:MBL fold metallo-hydrolase [Woeseiaceae bacterium]
MQFRWTGILLLVLLLPASAFAQDESVSFRSTALAPGLFMLHGEGGFAGGNLGLLTGDDGVILIDDGLEPLAETMLAAVQDTAGAPVDFVINTHVHGDHIGGNAALHRHGARIVAHDNIRHRMTESGAAADSLPELTFPDQMTFHLNDHRAEVIHVRSAHTDGDSIIHFPDANVIHTGDAMFNGLFPFIDLDSGGSVDGFIAAQTRIIELADDDTQIIPGHGQLASRDDLIAARDMLADAKARVGKLIDDGLSLEAVVAANPLAGYHDAWNWDFIATERMTETLYRDLKASQ